MPRKRRILNLACPECRSIMAFRAKHEYSHFETCYYLCSNWPECRMARRAKWDGSVTAEPAEWLGRGKGDMKVIGQPRDFR